MGDLAVITTSKSIDPQNDSNSLGIYLLWCGREDSVKAFLTYCKIHGFRSPSDDCWAWTLLADVICNYIGNALSCGIDVCSRLNCDNYENGVYIIDGWDIVDHKYSQPSSYDDCSILEFLCEIDDRMPKHMQLGHDVILRRYDDLDATF